MSQRRKWQPTPVCLPGKSHEHRNLAGYSPWGHKRAGQGLATKQITTTWTAWQFKMFHTNRTKEKILKASRWKNYAILKVQKSEWHWTSQQ